jgi:hypothetical protein
MLLFSCLSKRDFSHMLSFSPNLKRSKLNIKNMNQSDKHNPNTVDAVVDVIISELTLEERVSTADLDEDELRVLELTLGKYIRHRLDQFDVGINKEIVKDCLARSGESLDDIDAATVIIKELWKRLRETHGLRVVK